MAKNTLPPVLSHKTASKTDARTHTFTAREGRLPLSQPGHLMPGGGRTNETAAAAAESVAEQNEEKKKQYQHIDNNISTQPGRRVMCCARTEANK